MTLDPVARLILDEADPLAGRILVLDDVDGALTRHLLDQGHDVRCHCDDLRDALAVPEQSRVSDLTPDVVAETDVVLLRLPSALAALDDVCGALLDAREGLRLVAGGRVKHMTVAQNEVLARHFATVTASRGRDKSRVLHATGHRPDAVAAWPRSRYVPELDLTVWAFGRTFATNRLDAGTRLLIRALSEGGVLDPGKHGRALDLGSGSGILAALLARAGWTTEASDVSAAAVSATALTAKAAGLDVRAVQRDGLADVPEGAFDLIVTNPPFHRGAAKDSTPTLDAIGDADRALAPGGEFWCVFNSHLPYLAALHAAIGPTRIVVRDRAYTVTRSVREPARPARAPGAAQPDAPSTPNPRPGRRA